MIIPKSVEKFIRNREDLNQAILQFEHLKRFFDVNNFQPKFILDVGCGAILLSAMLAKISGIKHISFLDGPSLEGSQYGSLLIRSNGLNKIDVKALGKERPKRQFDLIFSFRSWGHNYDIDYFSGDLRSWLKDDGYLVLDIRKNTDGRRKLENLGLKFAGVVFDHFYKCDRLAWRWC